MKIATAVELRPALEALQGSVLGIATAAKASGVLKPHVETHFKLRIDQFRNDDQGPHYGSAQRDQVDVESWFYAAMSVIDDAKKSHEYKTVVRLLGLKVEDERIGSEPVNRFLRASLTTVIPDSIFKPEGPPSVVDRFMRELEGEAPSQKCVARLEGVIVTLPEVRFTVGGSRVRLRQVQVEDLEVSEPLDRYLWRRVEPIMEHGTAVLEIEATTDSPSALQRQVEKSVAILRLFGVGSVNYLFYTMQSDAFFSFTGGTLSRSRRFWGSDKYVIRESDVDRLRRFWKMLWENFPDNISPLGNAKVDHLSIAYERYSQALIEGGKLEKRIADAVMALEALFFREQEQSELNHRLSMRLALVFGALGHDPTKTRRLVKEAYQLRSKYVHGSAMDYDDHQELQKNHGTGDAFLRQCLEWVRVTLLLYILNRRDKPALLDLLDSAMIDPKRRPELEGWVNSAREILPTLSGPG